MYNWKGGLHLLALYQLSQWNVPTSSHVHAGPSGMQSAILCKMSIANHAGLSRRKSCTDT